MLFALLVVAGFGLVLSPWARPAVVAFSRLQVAASGRLIHLFGGQALVQGAVLRAPASGFAVEMKDGCNALSVTVLLCAAVLAFPVSWGWRVKGVLGGTAAIQGVNFIRFLSLFYLGQWNMALFDFAHVYLWESLIMLDALVVFWLWVRSALRPIPLSHAGG